MKYTDIKEVPTPLLASQVVSRLISCEGNLNRYKTIITILIRELRGEPQLYEMQKPTDTNKEISP